MTTILWIIGYIVLLCIIAYPIAKALDEFPKTIEDTLKYQKQIVEDTIKIMELKRDLLGGKEQQ